MHKKRRATSSLCVFFFLGLFLLLLTPLLIPALGSPDAQEYDYIDNNTSNVDASSDKGMHSNFTAQQSGPNSIYDNLTEENTGEAFLLEDFVDNNNSDVDNSPDIGTHSNFGNQKAQDSSYDILTETIQANTHSLNATGGYMTVGDGTPNWGSTKGTISFWIKFDTVGGRPWGQQDWMETRFSASNLVLDWGASGSLTSTTSFATGTWYFIAIVWDEDSDNLHLYVGDKSNVPALDSSISPWTDTVSNVGVTLNSFMASRDGQGPVDGQGDELRYWNIDRTLAEIQSDYDTELSGSETNLRSYFKLDNDFNDVGPDNNDGAGSGSYSFSIDVPFIGSAIYDLDLEVQWTSVIEFLPTENLCIYAGALENEDLRVDYWNGTGWENLATDLTANSWNNYTVSLTSTTFTIRFKGGTESNDTTQDTWQIDASLLRVAGSGAKEDTVDNATSDVDSSPDYGTVDNFENMKTKDGMTTLTEGLSAVWSNNSQPSAMILETDPDISGSATTYETYGLNNLASDDSTYGGGDIQDCGIVNDPQEVSLIMEFDYSGLGISGSAISHLRFESEVYFIGAAARTPRNDPWEMETTFYNGSVDIFNWNSGSWEMMGTVFIDNPNDLSIWDTTSDVNPERPLIRSKDFGFSDGHMNSTGFIRIRIQMTGVFQGASYDGCSVIDYVDVDLQYSGGDDYLLDQEFQWTHTPYQLPNEELCIYGGTMGSEDIKVEAWNGTGWETVFADLSSGWNNQSVTNWLTDSTFTTRFKGANELGDAIQDQWQIDIALIHVWTTINYELDLEVQWTNATYTKIYEEICVFGGTMGSENIQVDIWTGSTWHNLFTDLSSGWNNISVTDYLTSSTFTIRFKGETETNDTSRDSWEIDSTLLHTWGVAPIANFTYNPEQPYTAESITFNASASYDPDGSIISYFWDFGDGTNSTDEVTTHTYSDDGAYAVILTVTDNHGLSDSASADVMILNRPPIANFTESAETVYTNETIAFNASESYDPDGNIVDYFWDFGDGTNGTGVAVGHAYTDDGNYTVTLTVSDDDGATDSATASKTVLNRDPVASFTESAETVLTGETIYFNASDSYDSDGAIVGYLWDFGDGTNATGVTAEHAYADDGNYTVTLTVIDDDGAVGTTTATKTILNRSPVASFIESAETVYTAETIAFNASGSYDPDGTIVGYFWDFGDGTNATGVLVDHAYSDDGNYTVTLTVTDDDGATAIAIATKTVLNRPPVASFTESAESVYTGESITFNATESYDLDGSIVGYFWDFGDGSNATGAVVNHTYADDGNYTVTLTVTDNDTATDSASSTKTVLNRPPFASFAESAETVYTDVVITFNASDSYDPDGSVVEYFWDFGDGTNGTGIVVGHAYADDGNYTVTLTVTDDDGATDTATATKTVLNKPPVAAFTESAEVVYTDEPIVFNATGSYDPDGSIISYFWDFGDGTNGTGMLVNHSYAEDGDYTVTLTVTDDDGETDSAAATKTALNRPPVPLFTESAETVYTGETITFDASDSYDPDGSVVSYFWDFGDGTNSTSSVVVIHSYADDGVYTVTLTVTDDDGASTSASANKTIMNRPPNVSFTESAETVLTGETITFNASDSYDPDGTIASFFWDFGDGINATGVVVAHSYMNDGVYIVTVTVTDNDGATGIANATKTVLNRPPVALFTESAETVYIGEVITFNASDSYDLDGSIVSYFWLFGDGTNTTGVVVDHAYATNGTFVVTLTVTDDDGANASSNATKTVLYNDPPVAIFTESAETVYTDESITFNATDSYDPNGFIVSYVWDFGDGINATGVVVAHYYADDGEYVVTLTVTDDRGAIGTATANKTVLNRPPAANFTESAETVLTSEVIYFNASASYDADGTVVSYFWDFGDGANASGVLVEHSYADDGIYTVTLTVTDDDGAIDAATSTKTVLNRQPVASFTESDETVYTDEAITFNASSSYDSDGLIISYFWDFGDGTNATGVVVDHSYVEDGNYTVTLTTTDDDGATASTSAVKTVLNRPPVAIFTETAETAYTDETITFNATDSYDPDGSVVSYFWDFGDNTNATGLIVTHSYADNGIYTVTLTVTDNDGSAASATATKTILNRPPTAIFTESAETVYTGETISFNASDSYDSDGYIISYFWNFGDGTNATGTVVEHAYADDGNYTVTLTITDDDNASATVTAVKTVLNRSPIASFTESAETVYTSETIYFNASDSYDLDGTIASYFWDFGDGTNTTGAVVEHAYADDGNYTVSLTIIDNDGAASSITATKTVLNRPPIAMFSESAEIAYTGETITFNATESYDSDGYIVSYFWDFGDGANGTGTIVSHAYTEDGVYTVTLTVTDDDGGTASTSATKTILNRAPIANFSESAETVYTNETIYFNASLSYDPDGTIVSYFWDFGDGTNASGIFVEHAYADNGAYTVILTVTDNDGATGTDNATKTILNRPPVAVFTESTETVYTDESIYFNASQSYDADGTIINYFWDFGDGNNATGVTAEHAFADDGTYVVTLTVTDDDGASDTTTSTKTVLNRSPVANFSESAETVNTNEVIYFDASASYDLDGTIVNCFWDFGDGNNATGVLVEHSYLDDGVYTVTLTVTDNDGAVSTTAATKTVLNRPPVALFTESAETIYTGETITFNASDSYDPDGTILSYFWDFGDGTNTTGVIVGHSYVENGNYTVTLTVTDDDGATSSTTATKIVLNQPPVASFTESAETVYTDETITFNATNSYDPDGTIINYFWDFGDGTNAAGIIASHAYADDGNYTVTLTVTDNDGATGIATATKFVLNRGPVAVFSESSETVYTGEAVSFNASDSYDPDGTIVNYLWDFGDGINATGVIVGHTYVDDGNYTVTLTVTDDDAATAIATATKHVLNRPPVADFTESAETVYTGENITFNASSSYDLDGIIVSYFWDFGDGTNATGVLVEHSYADDGVYTVTLTAIDDDGASSSISATKTVLNRSPVAVFTESAETVYTGEAIAFNASDSYDSDGTIVSYRWDFGDGTNATGITAEHTYVEDGNYTVTLTITDNDGAAASTSAVKTVLNCPPVALFGESAETVLTGTIITFDASASYDPDGTIVSYFWNFGDGTNATGITIGHSYADDGNYTVTLTVTDNDGATAVATAVKTVLNRSPVAIFTPSATTVYTGQPIYFDASDSYDSDGTIVTYFWDFGDGTNATGVVVEHAYSDDGAYVVTLTVTDDDGSTGVATATIQVLNRSPVAAFTESAETVYTSEIITFNASDSYDLDGYIVSCFWDFGDGSNATGIVVTYAYADDGNFTVALVVTDDDGATDTTTAIKTVLNRPPVASFTESAETVLIGEIIYFNASAGYDPDGYIVIYFWDFGDGTNATGVTAEHAYSSSGVYTVTLILTDDDGATGFATATKTVEVVPPVAVFTESAGTVYTGEVIYFNASDSYDPDGYIVGYFWDFGDGTNASGVLVAHSYADDGIYTVTLTVTDDDGAIDAATSAKTVLNRPPVGSFTESAETVYTSEAIIFNASSSYDPDGTIVSYFWDFGDGTNATGSVVSHSYVEDGNYTVTLAVIDDDGTTASTGAVKTVLNRPPMAIFTETAETVYTDETITFNASDSYDPDGSIISYFWDFGDGTNATGVAATHSYTDDGVYTVTLTVTDNDGSVASAITAKTILNRPPIAIFTESAETVYTDETISFNASASHDVDGYIVSYFWDFGDGTNATGVAVEHAYADNGNYTATLTVIDDDNATATVTAAKTVLNRSPIASFTESAETVHTGEIIYFNASASYDLDGTIVSYFWDFGDGTNGTGIFVEHAYADDGNYTVSLTITDNDGATSSTTATKTVLNSSPMAMFSESAEIAYTGETITFNATESYDSDGYIVDYFWDFGDGANGTGTIVSHSYTENGSYVVTLTITDDDDATASTNATKTILNRVPIANFTESAETVYTNEVIYFNASLSYDPDGIIVSYFWDFDDGANATGIFVEHAYAEDRNYTVTLVVTDDDGGTATATATKQVLNRPPVVNFTESAETVYTGENITFNASSSYDPDGIIANYFWDFGDGTNATGVLVEHSYADDGVYIVTLTVIDDDGASSSISATKNILNRSPVAVFTESAETVYTGEAIAFNASDSYDPDGSIVGYFWDFGDGTNGTGVTTEHTYVEDGNYNVSLTITDDDGATVSTSAVKTVLNRPPVVIFSESAETVLTGGIITFDASASYDPDGTIVTYFWDFGDGTNATGITIGHSYADDGNYTVTLKVTDNDGATAVATAVKTVLNRAPVAIFTPSATTVYTGQPINFDASDSYDSDGTIVTYFWDFGDGGNATGVVVEHAYADDGAYVVTLTVTDDDGSTGVATATIQVLNRSPVAAFTESAETVYTSEIITFNASDSYDPDGYIVSYFWNFGDGSNATGMIVTHAYADDGNFTVTLTVTDDDGATDTTTAIKTVLNRPPVASFTESAETVLIGEVIYFNASASYDPDGTIISYFWDFGDGTNATGVTAEHAYSSSGVYTVTLILTDDDGATGIATATKTVEVVPPVALFTESAETVYTGEVIYFNASDSYDPDGYIVSYFWDFGDGTNASGVTAEHAYTNDGNYTVILTVTDNDGATDTAVAIKTVLNRSPVALFTESAETVYTDEVMTLNASGSFDPDGYIVSYFWNFGDGTNASGMVVAHAYTEDGNYTVTLTVTDDNGAIDATTATKTVLNRSPIAIFTESAETVYTDETITFNASNTYDPDGTIASYFWDFGDGTNTTGVVVSHSYADDGIYIVMLTVTDDDGATASANAAKTVLNRSPVAIFTESAETVYTGEVITFNGSDSYDPDGLVVSYLWDFGDGSNATGVIVGHAYVDDGAYVVQLTIADDDGATNTTTSTKTVLNRSPVAIFSESAESVLTGEIIYFNASGSYDPDGTVISYFWNFGDGTNATGVTVEHAYADDGNYTVILTVKDNDGAANTATAIKTVLNRAPVALFTESAETVYTDEVITFNASESYDSDGYIASFFWDFGDGANATGMMITHSYADDGDYTVTLTVTDDDGASALTTAAKIVLNRPPVASFTESAEMIYTGEIITFNATDSYDPDGTIISYWWDFDDGTNATGITVEHTYVDDGVYTVTLTVTDDDGATASTTATKSVLNRPPVAIFTESTETVYTEENITFNASDSYDLDGTIVSYFWDFGDGTNVTGIVANHAYADDGNYTVTLTVTDDDGATDTASSFKTVLNRPPVAIFSESAESVLTGEIIYFNASDSYDLDGYIVSYFWDFGDGVNATGITTEHAYSQEGTFIVTFTVTDDDGATASTTATKFVGNSPPVAIFTESAETVYTGNTITFDASDSYDPDGTIVSYLWDFGDGSNATGMVVGHAYTNDGNYTVTLTVTDDVGAPDTTAAVKTVLNRPPVASLTPSSTIVFTNEVVYFDASSSYDRDGYIVSYSWDFGDGTNATGITTEHAYADNGTYTVTLTVTDDDEATSMATVNIEVLNRAPIAVFTESAETAFTGEIIYFNASVSYDSDGLIISYFWDFGDGTNATEMLTEHSYAENGTYTVTLTIIDDDGATASTTAAKTILNTAPVAIFSESAETVYTDEVIYFNASASYDPDGTVVGYFWDFGDGANATGVTVEHSYIDDGVYNVTLTTTDNDGAISTRTSRKTVLNRQPIAILTESATTVSTDEIIYFNASDSYDPDGAIVNYVWNFGDGTNATGATVEHAYADNGTYLVTLTVTDDDGATGSTTATKTILNRSPVCIFAESAETVYVGQPIYFNASDSYDLDGTVVSYLWDFGDGANATGVAVEHIYSINGTYTVTLTVTDDDGATNSTSSTKTVLWNEPPIAVFSESAETVYTGETIYFNASDSYDLDGTVVSYLWDFGDGANATGVAVEHTYIDDGVYNVTLTVIDDRGAIGTANSTKTVLNRLPVAVFTESAETVYTGETIYFNASASYDSDGTITSYFWNFDDGTNATGVTVKHVYADNGTYTVTLTVTDNDGATSSTSTTKTVYNRAPVASFTHSPDFPIVEENVTFDASASYDLDGAIVDYAWNFGDGNVTTSTTPVVTHVYAIEGNYTVTLTVMDDDGETDTVVDTLRIRNYPSATFTYSPIYPGEGKPVTFDASLSTPNGGIILNYTWDFGDGNAATVTEPVIVHVYQTAGNYTVTLTITDSEGLSDSQSETVDVGVPPVASFTYSPITPLAEDIVTFDASASYDPDGYIVSYTWDFGDGNVTTVTGPLVTHVYAIGGNFVVKLTIIDDEGISDVASDAVSVRDYPTADFTWSPGYPIVNQDAIFDASASTPNGGVITSYLWDFGDGTPLLNTTNFVTIHIFTSVGEYNVTLTVVDSEELTNAISKVVKVIDYPTANFTWSPPLPIATESITFNASSSKANSGTIIGHMWNLGDGTVKTGYLPIVTHAYVVSGNYSVILTVINSEGLSSSITRYVTVLNAPPICSFEYSPEIQIAGETTIFDASASYDPDGFIVSYAWDFGDGNVTTVTGPVLYHVYTRSGFFNVTLTVTDDIALTTSTIETLKIIAYPTADFTWSPSIPESSKPITFNASMSTPNSGVINNYTWDFGDGNITTVTEPVIIHVYSFYGNYTVTLTVLNSEGLSNTKSQTVAVLGSPPEADFDWQPSSPLVNETVTFNASSSVANGGLIMYYEWDFGDGTSAGLIGKSTVLHEYLDYGQYIVTLKVTDSEGLNDVTSKTVTVRAAPHADFIWSPEDPEAYEIVTFDASASTPNGGAITSYVWDFGDGNITAVNDPTITHYYTAGGNYTIKLNITDSEGLYDVASKTISVTSPTMPQAEFSYSPISPYVFETIIFNASDSTPGVGSIVSYTWDLGDGNITTVFEPILTHAYEVAGNYTVTLKVVNSAELADTTSKIVTVLPTCGPAAIFTFSPEFPRVNKTVTFNASASTLGWNGTIHPPIISYTWNFGDGNVTTVSEPIMTHIYTLEGNYTVTLTVTDVNGLSDSDTQTLEVGVGPPYDINGDGKIDIWDVAFVASHFGTYEGGPNWDPAADITGPEGVPDGVVDVRDIALVASHFGEFV